MGTSMIPLSGRTIPNHWAPTTDLFRVIDRPGGPAALTSAHADVIDPRPEALLLRSPGPASRPSLQLPPELGHLSDGDIVAVSPEGTRLHVLWKATARHNAILLTERCENYCLMCSQPPKERDDAYLYDRARRLVDLLSDSARAVVFTGGEPTVDAERFVRLLEHVATSAPQLSVHVLSNGRRFADRRLAARVARIPLSDLMIGIPLYAAEAGRHDYVVQAEGAFDETIRGILSLAEHEVPIEIRVVVQQATVPVLSEIAQFIARNLPFVAHVALMGLEMTGLALPNATRVWIDPWDYRDELRRAHRLLDAAGIRTDIYNHQLCVLDRELWPFAVQSISDWKNDFPEVCEGCSVREQCGGVFTTSKHRLSRHLAPVPSF